MTGLLSKAALQNNIGVLLRRRGSDEEATSRFRSSILSSSSPSSCDECVEGLAWFHRKLSKELANTQPAVSACAGTPRTTDGKRLDRRSLLARSKSKRESLVSVAPPPPCDDGRTPLGLEYFSEGVAVGEGATDGDVEAAARVNLASALYCASDADFARDDEILALVREASSLAVDPSLRAVASSNAGVVLFRRGNAPDALASFQRARDFLASDEFRIASPSRARHGGDAAVATPPSEYLRIGCDLNAARAAVRLNDADLASKLVKEIASISTSSVPPPLQRRMRWLVTESRHYISGLVSHRSSQWSAALCSYNEFIAASRKTLGHDHPHVATVLHHRGDVLFEQRNFHNAMISYLASLQILESLERDGGKRDPLEKARTLYSIGRTLHDREEFPDALRMYHRSLAIRKSLPGNRASVDVITTLCNIGRVHHLMGDVDAALGANREAVELATALAGGRTDHPFVVARRRAMGNMLVEAGRTSEAMEVFASVARASGVSEGYDAWCDHDGSEVAKRTAVLMAKAGLQHSCAPTA